MKYIKYLLIPLLIFSFVMVSCKKDSTTGSKTEPIVGTWNVVEAVLGWLITISSNQVATNPFDGSQTNIPANTPTFVKFMIFDGDDGFGLNSIEFRSDGTATVTEIDDDGTYTENWDYTTDGDLLTITDELGDTEVFEYFIDGNTLTMIVPDVENYCEDYNSQAECFADTESFFGLTGGSLTAVRLQLEIILNRGAAKPGYGLKVGKDIFNPSKIISDYKLNIDNLKKSL